MFTELFNFLNLTLIKFIILEIISQNYHETLSFNNSHKFTSISLLNQTPVLNISNKSVDVMLILEL